MKRIFLFLFILAYSGWTNTIKAQQSFDPSAAHYIWPTEASSYLSSTFSETRSAHFHAALDIKTWGRRGYEVYATRDGIVDRIAIGPRGYGKVVYLKHDDGSYSVYAHLLSFNEKLQEFADSVRFAQDYRFEMQRFLGWKNIKVKQGEVIGYSGASGIGPPHLHFELRTPSEKPFNPLLTNLKVKDTIAPRVLGISVEPLSAESSIEGENAIYTKKTWGKKSHYDFGTIDISGPVGLGINAFDRSNDVYNSYAVYELSMAVDGQEFFKSRVDSFSYHETDQMFIDRVYPLLKKEGDGYQRLYVVDGNTLPFYETGTNKGQLNLSTGKHSVSIRTTDYYGNTTTTSVQLNVKEPKVEHPRLPISAGQPIAPPDTWRWFSDWVTLTETQFNEVTVGLSDSSNYIRHQNGVAVKLDGSDPLFMNIPRVGPVRFYRLNPANVDFVMANDMKSFARFPKHTSYDTVSVGMSVHNHSADSITVNILPEAYPLRKEYLFYLPRDAALTDTKKLSFYHRNQDDVEWELVPTKFTYGYIITETESLGTFRLLRDITAPELKNPRLRKRPDGQWLVMIDVEDDLSGIDYSKTKISVNDIPGIAEYEPEDDRFVYYHPNFKPSASMKINVDAWDKMGNRQSSTFLLDSGKTKK